MARTFEASRKRTLTLANRSQDTFYNPEGALAVSVTGSSGRAEENTETYSVVYALSGHPKTGQ